MAGDDWQLEAVHEQFKVFEALSSPYTKIPSFDFSKVMVEVNKIVNLHLKMNNPKEFDLRTISAEIMKHPDRNEIKLSFILIVTSMENNGSLCKMPVFVVMCDGKKKFIDMNLTLFSSWKMFLNTNSLPSCQYCFPVDGQYSFGGKLKIDFASSPVAKREEVSFLWKGVGFVVAVGIVAGSFFFTIAPIRNAEADSLLGIANDFIPGIKEYGRHILTAVRLVQNLKSGNTNILSALPDIWKFMTWLNDNYSDHILSFVGKVKRALWKLYVWIKGKLSDFFKFASAWAQNFFMATVSREDNEIITMDSEAEDLLEASRINFTSQNTVDAAKIHATVNTGNDSEYSNTIFRNAKLDSALQRGIKDKEILHPVTSDLLTISNDLAKKLGKSSLKDVQDIFETLSDVVKEEFNKNVKTYTKTLTAVVAGVGHPINHEEFNKMLGIEGDPKEYYWKEAIIAMSTTLVQLKIEHNIKKKHDQILILPLTKKEEGDVIGLYRIVGVYGSGYFKANDLIKALKETEVSLNEENVAIDEHKTMIMIRTEDLSIVATQELNSENTSQGTIFINRIDSFIDSV